VEAVSRWAVEGWAIAADPHTVLGRLAALTAETACVPFMAFDRVIQQGSGPSIAPLLQAERSAVRDII
jgi:hypothetical protein